MNNPSCFFSYSWENKEHKDWVRVLATKLRDNGIDVTLDKCARFAIEYHYGVWGAVKV